MTQAHELANGRRKVHEASREAIYLRLKGTLCSRACLYVSGWVSERDTERKIEYLSFILSVCFSE